MGDDLSSVTGERSRGGAVKVTHMEARCCNGSWTCSLRSERSSSTDRYQRPSGPLERKGEMNGQRLDGGTIQNLEALFFLSLFICIFFAVGCRIVYFLFKKKRIANCLKMCVSALNSCIYQEPWITELMFHLKLFSEATVGIGLLLLEVALVVLDPHSHTPAQRDKGRHFLKTTSVQFTLFQMLPLTLDRYDHFCYL